MSIPQRLIEDLQRLSEPEMGQVIDFVAKLREHNAQGRRFSWQDGFLLDAPDGVSLSEEGIRQRRED